MESLESHPISVRVNGAGVKPWQGVNVSVGAATAVLNCAFPFRQQNSEQAFEQTEWNFAKPVSGIAAKSFSHPEVCTCLTPYNSLSRIRFLFLSILLLQH